MDIRWLEPWHPVGDSHREFLVAELDKELIEGHSLFGLPVIAIGRRHDRDDVLFRLGDGSGRFAVVHLTWSRRPEVHAGFPWTEIFESFEDWTSRCMRPDHEFCQQMIVEHLASTQEELHERKQRQPFQPFRVILFTGVSYDIRHPDLIMVGHRSAMIGVTKNPEATRYESAIQVDLLHVVGVEDIPAPTTTPNGTTP